MALSEQEIRKRYDAACRDRDAALRRLARHNCAKCGRLLTTREHPNHVEVEPCAYCGLATAQLARIRDLASGEQDFERDGPESPWVTCNPFADDVVRLCECTHPTAVQIAEGWICQDCDLPMDAVVAQRARE